MTLSLHFNQFIKSMVLPRGFRIERLRTDKGGEYTSDKFRDYCLQTGVLLEYASTNTPQQIGMSERVGRTLAAMVRCMLADSGLPKFLWGELMFTAAFWGNRAPHSAIGMQSPYKMLNGTEPDLRLLRVIGARAFVHIETYTKKLELKAVEGRLVGYSNNSKSYRVFDPATRRIMESRNVVLIETPPQILRWNNDLQGHNYATDEDFIRDVRDYTSVLDPLSGASIDHMTVGALSKNPQVAELLEKIRDITRKISLQRGISELSPGEVPQDGTSSGGAPTEGAQQEDVLEPLEQSALPGEDLLEAPLAGTSPLRQRGHSHLEVTPAVTRAGSAARSFEERKMNNHSNSSHLATIATRSALSDLRGLGLYNQELFSRCRTRDVSSGVRRRICLRRNQHSDPFGKGEVRNNSEHIQGGHDPTGQGAVESGTSEGLSCWEGCGLWQAYGVGKGVIMSTPSYRQPQSSQPELVQSHWKQVGL